MLSAIAKSIYDGTAKTTESGVSKATITPDKSNPQLTPEILNQAVGSQLEADIAGNFFETLKVKNDFLGSISHLPTEGFLKRVNVMDFTANLSVTAEGTAPSDSTYKNNILNQGRDIPLKGMQMIFKINRSDILAKRSTMNAEQFENWIDDKLAQNMANELSRLALVGTDGAGTANRSANFAKVYRDAQGGNPFYNIAPYNTTRGIMQDLLEGYSYLAKNTYTDQFGIGVAGTEVSVPVLMKTTVASHDGSNFLSIKDALKALMLGADETLFEGNPNIFMASKDEMSFFFELADLVKAYKTDRFEKKDEPTFINYKIQKLYNMLSYNADKTIGGSHYFPGIILFGDPKYMFFLPNVANVMYDTYYDVKERAYYFIFDIHCAFGAFPQFFGALTKTVIS